MKQMLCLLFFPALLAMAVTASGSDDVPTFSRDIAPIVYENCVVCHRPGQAAPFSLISYQQVSRRARLCAHLIETGYMPPWKPVAGHGDFVGEKRLTEEEVALFREWVATGRQEGDPEDLPDLPQFPDRWQLGEPDLVLEMADCYSIPADGPDIYRNFLVDTGLHEEAWVRAIELRPTTPEVVHHVIVFGDSLGIARALESIDEEPGFSEMIPPSQLLGGYVPGAAPMILPEGLSLHLPKGSPLVLQAHFHPSGKPEVERFQVGVYLADKPSEKTVVNLQMPEVFGIGTGIDIPAGADHYQVDYQVALPVDSQTIAVGGHAHYLGREMQLTATYPDGRKKSLFYIDDWDLDWQGNYTYQKPEVLPAGTVLTTRITYDNSAENSSNPFHPPRRVRWGKESTDEMGSITLVMTPIRESDAGALSKLVRDEKKRAMVGLFSGGKVPAQGGDQKIPSVGDIMRTFDSDGSGQLSKTEFPILPDEKRFARLDRNKDSQLDSDELKSMVRLMNLVLKFGMGEEQKTSRLVQWVMKKQLGLR